MDNGHLSRLGGMDNCWLTGILQAYDSHCNLVLGEVEETIYTVDEEDEGGNGEVRTVKKQSEMLFVRGMAIWEATGILAGSH